jgi:hypothetical protein
MNFIVKLVRSPLTNTCRVAFSKDNWKDRDQSAEKVYISAEESKYESMKKKLWQVFLTKSTRVNRILLKKSKFSKENSRLS